MDIFPTFKFGCWLLYGEDRMETVVPSAHLFLAFEETHPWEGYSNGDFHDFLLTDDVFFDEYFAWAIRNAVNSEAFDISEIRHDFTLVENGNPFAVLAAGKIIELVVDRLEDGGLEIMLTQIESAIKDSLNLKVSLPLEEFLPTEVAVSCNFPANASIVASRTEFFESYTQFAGIEGSQLKKLWVEQGPPFDAFQVITPAGR